MKKISIVTPCFNEEDNVNEVYTRVKAVCEKLTNYDYEHIFIDNASEDKTVALLEEIAKQDPRVKIIVNARNFGHIRSPYYAMLQASGDAVISVVADLQDPPEVIPTFIKKWEEGFKIVVGVKPKSQESFPMKQIRKLYYRFIDFISEVRQIRNFTGFGLYDKKVMDVLKKIDDPYPYFRGLVSEVGFKHAEVEFQQPRRKRGITKNNFYTLYDIAMLGITGHSKLPIRIATMAGFFLSVMSFSLSIIYLILKLLFWKHFSMGMAPVLIGLFFFSSVQLFFIGLLGEYIGSIHTQVKKMPLVIEEKRVNFDDNAHV